MKNSEPASPERAFQDGLKLLAARDYTTAKMRGKLARRGFDEGTVEGAVARLESQGWLNDRRFAERFAETAVNGGRFFGPRLRQELRRHGVPAELVEEALGRLRQERDEQDDLRSVMERRFPGFSFPAADDRERRRVVAFLQRRGFGLGAIMKILKAEVID
ncbi:regulatory protein RecX [Geobacter sp. FeAm09]|uniref:regulatory protein RecX n=1 Tax=Geobacter sp. FeAm09 TaxID=2597769 RepID=UPI0011EFD82B|nr:regulatory protein RecX [Geobacter sp. FeAm09]QEM69450.1 regulatory protein RecX [Geobacter sp. FeAm09]